MKAKINKLEENSENKNILEFYAKNLGIKKYMQYIILLIVLYGCEISSLTLSEECRIRVFEMRILRQIFWPMMDENGEWRRLHNE